MSSVLRYFATSFQLVTTRKNKITDSLSKFKNSKNGQIFLNPSKVNQKFFFENLKNFSEAYGNSRRFNGNC